MFTWGECRKPWKQHRAKPEGESKLFWPGMASLAKTALWLRWQIKKAVEKFDFFKKNLATLTSDAIFF